MSDESQRLHDQVAAASAEVKRKFTEATESRGKWTSASNALADSLCVGRHLTQLPVPEQARDDADSGTRVHWALCHRNPNKLTLEEFSTYERCCEIEEKKVEEFFGPDEEPVSFRERRFWINLDGKRHSAQPDVVYRLNNRSLIIEYKSLFGDIEPAERNAQLRDQVVCVDHEFFMLEQVGVVVAQPHITMNPEIILYTPADIERARILLAVRVDNSNNPDNADKHTAGEVQCKFCRGKIVCKEYALWASAERFPSTQHFTHLPVAEWGPEQMATFLKSYPIASKWLKSCHDYIKSVVKTNPTYVTGWGIKPGAVERPVPGEKIQALFERFEQMGGDLSAFMKCVDLSKGRFAEAVAEVTGHKGKALDEKLDELYHGLTDAKQKDGSLVKIKG